MIKIARFDPEKLQNRIDEQPEHELKRKIEDDSTPSKKQKISSDDEEETQSLDEVEYISQSSNEDSSIEDDEEEHLSESSIEEDEEEETHPITQDEKHGNTWVMSQSTVPISQAHLSKPVINILQSMKISNLFPVQRAVVPVTLALSHSRMRGDILVCAPTGCGKTLAYCLPIIEYLSSIKFCKLRALILTPTKNLASQVYSVCKNFAPLGLNVGLANGTQSFFREQSEIIRQQKEDDQVSYHSKVDILIGTPHRIQNHLHNTKGFHLNDLRFLVLDEADKMLEDKNMFETLKEITNVNQQKSVMDFPQPNNEMRKIILSATLTRDVAKLKQLNIFRPQYFTYTPPTRSKIYTLPPKLKQYAVLYGDIDSKYSKFSKLLNEISFKRALCFANNIKNAKKLFEILHPQFPNIAEYHRNLTEKEKKKILKRFKNGKIEMIICSDAMARGMDVDVDVVFNFDKPKMIKNYIHRVGRTARAGKEGQTFTLINEEELESFRSDLEVVENCNLEEYYVKI